MLILEFGLPIVLVSLLSFAYRGAKPDFNDMGRVYRFRDGVWTPSPEIPGGAWRVRVSSRGDVWAVGTTRGGLNQLNGSGWTHYGKAEFGAQSDWIRGGFAISGEEVWGATDAGAVRFDGQSWHFYADALKTNKPASIVARPTGVWIIDNYGNLSQFDGGRWTIRGLSAILPGSRPRGGEEDSEPALSVTADGRLWIVWRGVWLLDGKTWREIRPEGVDLAQAWLIGHDPDSVWLWIRRTGEVVSLTAEGKIAARYRLRDMGLNGRINIGRLVAANGRIWLATNAGLVASTGSGWKNFGLPPGCMAIRNVDLAPDGSAWVVGARRDLAQILRDFGPPLA
ncbi:MAG: hypothetical protein ABSG25_06310, partial [Bryobacteraceae bacterium]